MRELPFQLQRPPNPPSDSFGELFRIPVNVDIGNYRKIDKKDGVFGRKVEIKFTVAFLASKSILHVTEKSYEELATFNRICFERRLILRSTKMLFPLMSASIDSTLSKESHNSNQRNSIMMSIGAAVGSPLKEVDDIPTNKDSVHALVLNIKVWLAALWTDQPLFHYLDYVRSFFELGNKAEIPVKPYLWCPTTLIPANKPLIERSARTTELAARIVAEAAALQPNSPGAVDSPEDARRPSLALFRGLKGPKRPDEQAPVHFEDIEGEEHTLRIMFKEVSTGLTIVNGDSSKDSSGKFNGPLFVKDSSGQAAMLGVQVGDRILAYNGKPVRKGLKSQEFKQKLKHKGRPLTLTISRKVKAPLPSDQVVPETETETAPHVESLSISAISSNSSALGTVSPRTDDVTPKEALQKSASTTLSSRIHTEVLIPNECVCRVQGSRLHFVEIYENQRFNGLLNPSWGSTPFPGHMLPADRSAWSSEDGSISIKLSSGEFSQLKPPISFEWVGEWEVDFDYTPCDDKGFAYALDFWLLTTMQEEGSSMESDADACFVRRRRWRRPLVQPYPPIQPTPCLSALSTADADGKGVYSRRAIALAMNISHRVFLSKSSEDSYLTLQNMLGLEGFDALWRGCGIAIVCTSHSTALDLTRALTSCGWPAMVFTAGKSTSLVDDSGSMHTPKIFVTTDADIKSSLDETTAAALNAQNGPGGDGIQPNLLPMPVDFIVHFELPKDFGTFLRRIERVFRGRLLEVNTTLMSVVLAKSMGDNDSLLPWLAALVSDANQLDECSSLVERAQKLKKLLAIDSDEVNLNESSTINQEIVTRDGKQRWDVLGAVGSVLAYNFGKVDEDDVYEDSDNESGCISVDGDGSTLYVNENTPATVSPFIAQQNSLASSSILQINMPLFSSAPQEDNSHTSESENSGEDF